MGVLNTDPAIAMNATVAPAVPPAGGAAFVSQSGALGVSVLDYANELGIGIAQFVSVGNKPDVSGNDLLVQWEDDPQVRVILMYVENFGNPRRFLEIASRLTRRKPMIAVKSGRSRVGAQAASSHTGALAASDTAVTALLAQAGVLRAASMDELFDLAMAFTTTTGAGPRSRRTAVLTNSGGPGILAADALELYGMEVPPLDPATVTRLKPLFPSEASIRNPLDMIASATARDYRTALDAILDDANVDSALAIFVPPLGVRQEDVAEAIGSVAMAHPAKPVFAVLMGRQGLPQGRAELHRAGVPAYVFPEAAARALAAVRKQREWRDRPVEAPPVLPVDRDRARAALRPTREAGGGKVPELDALALLESYGLPVASARLARTPDEAARVAGDVGFPVGIKSVSPHIVHKTDVGGVRLGLTTADEVRDACRDMAASIARAAPDARLDGFLVQQMVDGGRETIVGVARDRVFGPLVMFGLGGIFVEALRDVAFRIAPLTTRDARELIRGIRGLPVLEGVRGAPPVAFDALADAILRVSQLAVDFPEITELDLNPLLAFPDRVVAIDARVMLEQRATD
jgi:acyl-CoA synthetase (NDP forming)